MPASHHHRRQLTRLLWYAYLRLVVSSPGLPIRPGFAPLRKAEDTGAGVPDILFRNLSSWANQAAHEPVAQWPHLYQLVGYRWDRVSGSQGSYLFELATARE